MANDIWRSRFSRASDIEFRELLERLPVAAYTTDAEGLITWFNQDALAIWGRAPELQAPVDRFCGSWRLFYPDGTPMRHDQCWMALCLRDETGYNAREVVIERHDGTRRVGLAHANPIFQDGKLAGAVNVIVDITERKQAEVELRDGAEAKERFLAVLAHELRNPLAPIRSAIEIISRTTDADAAARAVETVDRQLTHLTRMVDDLMDVARISQDRLELRLARAELAPIVRHAVETAQPLIDAKHQRLEVAVTDEPIELEADHARLAQVISNLLANASRYSGEDATIRLDAQRIGSDVVISVSDEGVGLSEEAIPTIFEMFGRASSEVKEGLGVGLTLARQLAAMHGGYIDVRSAGPGQGSEFRVHLPAAARVPVAMDEVPVAREARPITGRRILVVDDNRDAAEVLGELLTLEGNAVRVCHDGLSAVEEVVGWGPEVVLLDIGLPRLDGYEVARRIRRLDGGDALMLVALTGWGQPDDRERSATAGFDHHLVKPVEFATLSEILRTPA